jgi:hypothetical protein
MNTGFEKVDVEWIGSLAGAVPVREEAVRKVKAVARIRKRIKRLLRGLQNRGNA